VGVELFDSVRTCVIAEQHHVALTYRSKDDQLGVLLSVEVLSLEPTVEHSQLLEEVILLNQ